MTHTVRCTADFGDQAETAAADANSPVVARNSAVMKVLPADPDSNVTLSCEEVR